MLKLFVLLICWVLSAASIWIVTGLQFRGLTYGCEKILAWLKSLRSAKEKIRQWPSCLLLLAGALKSGCALEEAMSIMVEEAPEPLRTELKIRIGQNAHALTKETQISLLFADPNLAMVRAALLLSSRMGGNSALLLESSARALRKTSAQAERVDALTAQSRLSAWVVGFS